MYRHTEHLPNANDSRTAGLACAGTPLLPVSRLSTLNPAPQPRREKGAGQMREE